MKKITFAFVSLLALAFNSCTTLKNTTTLSNETWELEYWSKKFGVTKEKLKEAVKAVGTSAAAVQKYLGK